VPRVATYFLDYLSSGAALMMSGVLFNEPLRVKHINMFGVVSNVAPLEIIQFTVNPRDGNRICISVLAFLIPKWK
jgi:hypothetical protein